MYLKPKLFSDNRGVSFTFKTNQHPESILSVIEFEYYEAMSELSSGYIKLASENHDLIAEDFIDGDGCLTVFREGEIERYFYGIIKTFVKKDRGKNVTFYDIELVPTVTRLTLRTNCRIFQQLLVTEIVEKILKEMHIVHYLIDSDHEHKKREFSTQYNETDFEYIQRILAEEGFVFSIVHYKDRDLFYIADDNRLCPVVQKPFVYNSMSGGLEQTPCIRQFAHTMQLAPTRASLRDYNFKNPPSVMMRQFAKTHDKVEHQGSYEHYDYPGRFKNGDVGEAFARTRIEYLRRDANMADAVSNLSYTASGQHLRLTEHPDSKNNNLWLITRVLHKGTQPQGLTHTGDSGQTHYSNEFSCIFYQHQWKATPSPKKRINGPQSGMIVGPEGEEIYVDERGRVKVHMYWDRHSNKNEQSSCFMRVAYLGAGQNYGFVNVPRIGTEVVIQYFDGDPDQPFVAATMFNDYQMPPYKMPAAKTKMVLRSQSHKSKGYNELSMEDATGNEEFHIHASKNMRTEVLNDQNATIKHDKSTVVEHDMSTLVNHDQINRVKNDQHDHIDHDYFHQVKNNAHYTVEGESRVHLKSQEHHTVDQTSHQKFEEKLLIKIGDEWHVNAGQKVVIEAGGEITFKVGGSFVRIDASGVHLVGPSVNINGGGSAGVGTPAEPLVPIGANLPIINTINEKKEITKIFWTYNNDEKKVTDLSRHYVDLNLHIETTGYKEGEILPIDLLFEEDDHLIKSSENLTVKMSIDKYGKAKLKKVFQSKHIDII